MISVKVLGKQVEKFVTLNAPAILTGMGVVGSVATAYLTGKATFKAAEIIADAKKGHEMMREPELTKGETFKLVWKEYLPPALVLTTTVTSIVCSNRVSTKRAAALAAAYSLSERRMTEYKDKVIEKFNGNKERQIRDEIAQDHVNANPPNNQQIFVTGNGDVLCHDLQTGRYFRSSMEKLKGIQNTLNAAVVEVGFATLQDLYVSMGLEPTPYSENLGWTTAKMLDLRFSAVLSDENQPIIAIDYSFEPLMSGFPKGCDSDPGF